MKKIIVSEPYIYKIKDSKFIGYLFFVKDIKEIEKILTDINNEHQNAKHIAYAYKINNLEKYFDDNEPTYTAGKPILDIINNNNLNYVLGVVVRYFGGTKLGSSLLLRSYLNTINETLKNSTINEYCDGYLIKIVFNYNYIKEIDYLLKNYQIIKKVFNDNVTYYFESPNKDKINHVLEQKIIEKRII